MIELRLRIFKFNLVNTHDFDGVLVTCLLHCLY